MKIRTKLFLTLGSLPILLLLLVVSGLLQISHIHQSAEEIEAKFDSSIIAGQIRADTKDEGIILRNLVIYDNDAAIEKELSQLQNEKDSIHNNIAILETNIQNSEQAELVETLKTTYSEFESYINSVVSAISESNKDEARRIIDENSDSFHDEFSMVLRNITNGYDTQLESSLVSLVKNVQNDIIVFSIVLGIFILFIISIFVRNITTLTKRMSSMNSIMGLIANGKTDLRSKVEIIANDEFDEIAKSFNQMTKTLDEQINKEKELTWKKSNIAEIATNLTSKIEMEALGQTLLSKVVPLVESSHALLYVKDFNKNHHELFQLISSYAAEEKLLKQTVAPGEGLVGQAILEKKQLLISDIPTDYLISSGLGHASPTNIIILPILFENEVNAILEIASFKPFTDMQLSFLEELSSNLGIVLESVIGRIQLAKLLEESQTLMEEIQAQSEELQNQQEELRATNEELEEQTQALRSSEQKLQSQQEELEQTNAELEEKAKRLEEQNIKYEEANRIVQKAKAELEVKAEQLALSSKYKSEFLANMSHELRTPLNSLIILSKLLADNPQQNLTDKQVEYAKTIYSSGNDLLILINSILDLAKIESGKTEILPGEVNIQNLVEYVQSNYQVIADNKNLDLTIRITDGTPESFYSDEVRIQQILKNLLSNAFKFTDSGEVRLEIGVVPKTTTTKNGKKTLAFSVIDTGIGIPKDKLQLIFEAFQQADGTTSRKYGGTGLGLSISRELATLLGGELIVESVEGKGSNFTFFVGDYEEPETLGDDSTNSEVAITTVEPSELMSETIEEETPKVDNQKSPETSIKRLLIVDDDINQRNSLMELIGNMDFVIKAVSTGKEAINLLKLDHFDCLILDLGLSDTSGFDLLARIKNSDLYKDLKVFVYTGRDLSSKEELQLNKLAHTIIIKNEHSPERLVEELDLYLSLSNSDHNTSNYYVEKNSPNIKLIGKKVLLVDDDVRNVFALSSVLELAGLVVLFAENGLECLEVLEQNQDIDLVLMDIMMPEMDGYEAITRLRSNPIHEQLPIIALTAKAMKEDRERCLQIGASDYIAKPVEPDQLLSLIKVWLY